MKVFYSREVGDFVVDALCECGHLKREHGSLLLPLPHGRMLRLPNDGSCCTRLCVCKRFTWAKWVTATEFEKMISPEKHRELALM